MNATIQAVRSEIDHAIAGNSYDANLIGYGSLNNVTLRDYIIGLRADYPVADVRNLVANLIAEADEQYKHVFRAVYATYAETIEEAIASLDQAYLADPGYSLTNLLMRMSKTPFFNDEVWQTYADQLHAKVKEELDENAHIPVETL